METQRPPWWRQGAGTVVKNEGYADFSAGRGQGKAAALPAGKIDAALAEVRFIAVGKALHEGICTGDLGRPFWSSSWWHPASPAEVFRKWCRKTAAAGELRRFRPAAAFPDSCVTSTPSTKAASPRKRHKKGTYQIYQRGFPGACRPDPYGFSRAWP